MIRRRRMAIVSLLTGVLLTLAAGLGLLMLRDNVHVGKEEPDVLVRYNGGHVTREEFQTAVAAFAYLHADADALLAHLPSRHTLLKQTVLAEISSHGVGKAVLAEANKRAEAQWTARAVELAASGVEVQAALLASGTTEQEVRAYLVGKHVVDVRIEGRITASDVARAYELQLSTDPAFFTFAVLKAILIPQEQATGAWERANEVYHRLVNGEPFEQVAVDFFSADEQVGEDGVVLYDESLSLLDEPYLSQAVNLARGAVSQPFAAADRIVILYMEDRRVRSLVEMEPLIRQELVRQGYEHSIQNELRAAVTSYKLPLLDADRYVDENNNKDSNTSKNSPSKAPNRFNSEHVVVYPAFTITGQQFMAFMELQRRLGTDISGYGSELQLIDYQLRLQAAGRMAYENAAEDERAAAMRQARQLWIGQTELAEPLDDDAGGLTEQEVQEKLKEQDVLTEQAALQMLCEQVLLERQLQERMPQREVDRQIAAQRLADPLAFTVGTVQAIYIGTLREDGLRLRSLEDAAELAAKLHDALAQGESFSALSGHYNEDELLRQQDGLFVEQVRLDQLAPDMKAALAEVDERGLARPYRSGQGYIVLRVDDVQSWGDEKAAQELRHQFAASERILLLAEELSASARRIDLPLSDYGIW